MPNLAFAKDVGYRRYFYRTLLWKVRTGLFQQQLVATLPTGLEFPLPSNSFFAKDVYVTEWNVDWNAEYILVKYLELLDGNGDFLDVGANIGYYTALLSPVARRVHAFEPDTRNHRALSEVITRAANARLVRMAVADQSGTMRLDNSSDTTISCLITDSGSSEGVEIEVTTLDDYCRNQPDIQPAVIKVDIEGFDILAVEGSSQIVRKHKPVFCIEYGLDGHRPNTLERLQAFLDQSHYSLYAICRRDHSILKYSLSLQKLRATELASHWTKMLFLVPEGDSFFSQLAARFPSILGRTMRPSQIGEFLSTPFPD